MPRTPEANTFNTVGERFAVYLVSHAYDSDQRTDTNYNVHTLRTTDFATLSTIAATTSYYFNGIATPISKTPGGVSNQPAGWDATSIGAFPRSPGIEGFGTHNGDIVEIIVYKGALSDADRQLVEDYLIDKYGL